MSYNRIGINVTFTPADKEQEKRLFEYCQGKQWLDQIDENLKISIDIASKDVNYFCLDDFRQMLKKLKKEFPTIAFKGSCYSDDSQYDGEIVHVSLSAKSDKTGVRWKETTPQDDWD